MADPLLLFAGSAVIGSSQDGILPTEFPDHQNHHANVVEALKALEEAYVEHFYSKAYTESTIARIESLWSAADRALRKAFVFPQVDREGKKLINPETGKELMHNFMTFEKPKRHAFKHLGVWIRLFGSPIFTDVDSHEMRHKALKNIAAHHNNRSSLDERIIKSEEFTELCRLLDVVHSRR